MHLVIDGFGGNAAKLWDTELVRRFLNEYPDALDMTKITEPRVLEYDAPRPEDSGVSGFVIIAESHISVHTFPHKRYVNIDIFSCQTFDHERALQDAKELFGFDEAQSWLLDRGLEWLDERQGLVEAQNQRAALHNAPGSTPGPINNGGGSAPGPINNGGPGSAAGPNNNGGGNAPSPISNGGPGSAPGPISNGGGNPAGRPGPASGHYRNGAAPPRSFPSRLLDEPAQ